jgi:indole-3-acetate monooxygenase
MALEARSSRIPAPAHFPFDGSAPSDASRGGFGARIRPATTPADRLLQTLSHWSHARAGTLRGEGLMTKGTQAVIWITQACLRVAETCFALGGGNAVYDSSPLQRRLRDLQAASQHAAVQPRHYVDAGSLLLSGAGRG